MPPPPRPRPPSRPGTPPSGSATRDETGTRLKAGRRTLAFALLVVGALLCQRLRLPWQAVGLAFSLTALVMGALAIASLVRLRQHGSVVLVSFGLAMVGFLALGQVSVLVLYPVQVRYQECLDQALTLQARSDCQEQLQDDMQNWTRRLIGLAEIEPGAG